MFAPSGLSAVRPAIRKFPAAPPSRIAGRLAPALLLVLTASLPSFGQTGSPSNEVGKNGQTGSKRVDGCLEGDPVVMFTGNFAYQATDLEIPGRGLDFTFERNYRNGTFDIQLGASLPWSPLGHGWAHNQHHFIVLPWTVPQGRWGQYSGPTGAASLDAFDGVELPVPGRGGPGSALPGPTPPPLRGGQQDSRTSGVDLDFVRGPGSIFNAFVEGLGSLFNYRGGTLRIEEYAKNGLSWDAAPGDFSLVQTRPAAHIALRQPDGTVETYRLSEDSKATLNIWHQHVGETVDLVYWRTKVEDRHGNEQRFIYDWGASPPLLTRIIDSLGREIELEYVGEGEGARLAKVRDFTGRKVVYSYSMGRLTSVKTPSIAGTSTGNDFPEGRTTIYEYGAFSRGFPTRHELKSIVAPAQVADGSMTPYLHNTYHEGRVVKQSFGGVNASGVPAGGEFLFLYEDDPQHPYLNWEAFNPESQQPEPFQAASLSLRIDPSGNVALFVFDSMGNDRVKCEFTGRIDPSGLDPLSHDIDTFVDPTGPRLRPSAPGYEPRIRGGDDPECFYSYKLVNADGLVTHVTTPGSQAIYRYDEGGPIPARGNLLRIDEIDTADPSKSISTVYAYEPFFNQIRATYHARGLDPAHSPPNGGANSPDRYRTLRRFDFEEGSESADAITGGWVLSIDQQSMLDQLLAWGIQPPPLASGAGDLNGDGLLDQINGNAIAIERAEAQVYADLSDPATSFAVQASRVERAYNGFSLLTTEVDPEGNATHYEYFSEGDPDGDGTLTPDPGGMLDGAVGSPGGGYLKAVHRPESVSTSYLYDSLGRMTEKTNPRGFVTTLEYNAVDEIVSRTNAKGYRYSQVYDPNGNVVEKRVDDLHPEIDGATGLPTGLEVGSTDGVVNRFVYDILDNLI